MTDAIQMPAPAMTVPAYTVTARVLHWIIAALVLIMIPLGIVIANEWGGPWQTPLYNLHKSLGAVILPLVVVRLIWRLTYPPAPLPADIPPTQQLAAHATHWALYALLIAQPLIGWIATSAYPAPLPVFGLFELPKIWREDQPFSERLFAVHRWMGIALGGVATMHIGAALHHHFVRKDRVLMRMLTG
jgi:cytochrome b561